MGRLASAQADVQKLISQAERGDRIAALDLAKTYRCASIAELVAVVSPLVSPSVEVFDCLADAMALKTELGSRASRPSLDLK